MKQRLATQRHDFTRGNAQDERFSELRSENCACRIFIADEICTKLSQKLAESIDAMNCFQTMPNCSNSSRMA